MLSIWTSPKVCHVVKVQRHFDHTERAERVVFYLQTYEGGIGQGPDLEAHGKL